MATTSHDDCTCCGKTIKLGKAVALEYDNRAGTYHKPGTVPAEYSLGLYYFGPTCGAKKLREMREAAKAAK